MKKIFISILLFSATVSKAQDNNEGAKHLKTAGITASIAGLGLLAGGFTTFAASADYVPKNIDFKTTTEYFDALNSYNSRQKQYKSIAAASFVVSGLCILFTGNALINAGKEFKVKNKTTASIYANPMGVSLAIHLR